MYERICDKRMMTSEHSGDCIFIATDKSATDIGSIGIKQASLDAAGATT